MRISASSSLRAIAVVCGRLLPARPRAVLERYPILLILVPLAAAAILMRLNNALRYPSLHGFDSYAHATYIWHVLLTWTVPVAAEGWGRFHPPLYYWLSALLWWPLMGLPPATVLKILNVLYGVIGLASAWIAVIVARRVFGEERGFAWAAGLFVLCLPVHIYTAPMLGNEGLSTVFSSVSLLLLVRFLEKQDLGRALWLGIALGLAMLTKFTAIVVVGTTGVTLAIWALVTGRFRTTLVHLFVVMGCVLALSGWFYGRNVALYGNPFQMSRDYFATKRIESTIIAGKRDLSSYLSFDTSIFHFPGYFSGPVLDSVWAGAYSTAWYDSHGNWFLPSALYDLRSHHAGRILMMLGLVPTFLILLGFAEGLRRVVIRDPDPVMLPMVVMTCCMMAMFIIYTFENRIFTAVKASYLLPAVVPISLWFALGLQVLARSVTLLFEGATLAVLGAAAFVIPVFTYQLLFEIPMGPHYWNSLGALEAIAGFPQLARPKFIAMSEYHGADMISDLYLAHENLSTLALAEDKPYEALAELRRAKSLAPSQMFGQPQDVALFLRGIDAEYSNTLSVIYDRLGWDDLALQSALKAVTIDPGLPEAHFDQGMVLMKKGEIAAAAESFKHAAHLDPGFADSHVMFAAAAARVGKCGDAAQSLEMLRAGLPRRTYPHEVGTGELHDASIMRRSHIRPTVSESEVEAAVTACRETKPSAGT